MPPETAKEARYRKNIRRLEHGPHHGKKRRIKYWQGQLKKANG